MTKLLVVGDPHANLPHWHYLAWIARTNKVDGIVAVGDVEGTARALAEVLGGTWDREAISRALPVGTWCDVASQVLAFMGERMRRTAGGKR